VPSPTFTTSSEPLKRWFWVVGALCVLAGAFGLYARLAHGHRDANYGNVVVWGLWVAAYIFFIGLSAGAFLISSLVYVFKVERFESIGAVALFTAVVTLLLALLSIVVDLGHMGRAWHVMVYANFKSPMAWMIYLYTAYFILLSAEMWFLLRRDIVARRGLPGWRGSIYRALSLGSRDTSDSSAARDRSIVRVLAIIGVPTAIMFHGGVGALFGTVATRGHWHSALFPLLFLLSALVSGGALLAVIAAIFQHGLDRNRSTVIELGRLVMALLLLDVLFQVSEYLVAFRGGIPGETAGLNLSLFGPYWPVFWLAQLVLGTIVPLALLLNSRARQSAPLVALACLLIVVGIFALRLNIVIPGLEVEEIRGLTAAVSTQRITSEYFPSLSEWLLTLGISGLGLILFGFGELLLPHTDKEADNAVRA
jgi:protein NrfD